jgi:hypothetical protein
VKGTKQTFPERAFFQACNVLTLAVWKKANHFKDVSKHGRRLRSRLEARSSDREPVGRNIKRAASEPPEANRAWAARCSKGVHALRTMRRAHKGGWEDSVPRVREVRRGEIELDEGLKS